jgi:hypothetical protein
MRYKLILALALAFVALALLAAPVRRGAAQSGLVATGISCIPSGNHRLECQATAAGGTTPYSYTWTPTPFTSPGNYAYINCAGTGTITISVTVTDANGSTSSYSDQFQCGGRPL